MLKCFNPNSKFIELPVHFFYKVEDKESELKNNDKLKVKLSDEQLNGIYEIVKVQAEKDIDAEVKKVNDLINTDPTLSADEKATQKEAANQEAEKAKQTIDAAKDLDGVNQSKSDGIKAIDNQHKSANAVSDKKIQTIENIDKGPKEHAEKSMSNISLIGSLVSLISGLGILLFRKRNGEKVKIKI